MANLQFPIYQKSLCDDLKKTFLKRASDTDPTRSADDVVTEVSEMLSTDIAVYAEKLLEEISEGLGEAEDGATSGYVTRDEWDAFISGTDADNVINRWSEAERLLSGMRETDNLNTILRYKLDVDVFSTLFTALDSSGIPLDLSDRDTISRIATIRANFGFWSVDFISALGLSETGESGAAGLYDRLDSWDDYSSETAEWVLSAYLGNDLNERIKALETLTGHTIVLTGTGSVVTDVKENGNTLTFSKGDLSFSKIIDKPNTLSGYGITDGVNSFEIVGEGNAFTGCNIDGHKITFTKGETFLPKATFDELFEKVNIGTQETPIYAIKAKYGFYSVEFVSALGVSSEGGSSGLSYERLDNWSDYTEDKSEWVLSAYLGNDLNVRVTQLESAQKGDLSWSNIKETPTTLSGYGITDGVNECAISGSGNAVTEIAISGHIIEVTKSETFLEKSVFDDLFEKVNVGTQEKPVYAIRAKYGFYSDSFVSALGKSTGADIGGGSGVEALYELVDVKANDSLDGVFGAKEGAALIYNGTYWVAGEAGLSETQLNSYLINNGYVTKNDVYTKTEIDSLLKFFEKVNVGTEDSPRYALHILESMGLYSDDFISALGKSTDGTGGGGVSYERLDSWEDYDESKNEWVLSAGLGYELYTDIATLKDKSVSWSDIKDTPTTLEGYGIVDAYTKDEVDAMILFEKVNIGTETNPVWAIHAKDGMGVYSDKFISALGMSSIGDTIGLYERLDQWDDYDSSKAGWVLSAGLGNSLNSRVTLLESEQKGHTISIVGKGSVVRDVTESADSLVFTKGELPFSLITEKPTTLAGYGITDAYTKSEVDAKILFEKVNIGTTANPVYAIRAKDGMGVYSESFISALGMSGSNGGSPSYDRLDEWSSYNGDKAGWVLSAYLGNDLNTRLTAIEGSQKGHTINVSGKGSSLIDVVESGTTLTFYKGNISFAQIDDKPNTLGGYGIIDGVNSSVIEGSGNAFTSCTIDGHTITFSRNITFLAKETFDDLFEKVNIGTDTSPVYAIRAKYGFYSDSFVSAMGLGSISSVIPYERLDSWNDYSLDKSEWVLSAYLGYDLNTRVTAIENSKKGHTIVISGSGNIISNVSESGNTLTFTKGNMAVSDIKGLSDALNKKLDASLKGVANGLATLDSSGKVPSAQLPSYVDDVLEYTDKASFPTTGESGKIYIDQTTNLTYRWGGTTYVEISQSLALGETSSTAYAGDKGKKNAEDIAALKKGKADKATTLSGYGITDAYTKNEVNTKLTDGSVTKVGTNDVGSATLPIYLKEGVPTAVGTLLAVDITGNAATASTLQNARTLWGQSFNGSANVSGDMSDVGQITFSTLSGTNGRALLYQVMADNDYFRIYVGATASDGGYAEIATADNGNEPIYVRQYSGVFGTLERTLTLLDENGNTTVPGLLTAANGTINGTLRVGTIPVTNASSDALKIDGNLIVTGGIVMYANDGSTIESGFAALLAAHIDGVTIKYNESQQKIYSVMTGIKVNGATYKPNETDGYITIPDYPTSLDWVNIENKPSTFTPSEHTHPYLPLSGGTLTGGLVIQETISAASYAWSGGAFHADYANIILRGNSSTGVSGIVFTSSKGTTDINQPTDRGFIQFHACGVAPADEGAAPTLSTSGESNKLVIGVGNDGDDMVYIQTPALDGLRHLVGTSEYVILDSGNFGDYAATKSHTHSYAGAASSGGAAYSADKINPRGFLTAYEEGSTTMGESGVNLYNVYNNGYPVTYGNLLHIYGLGAGQLLAEWCGSSTLGHLYYRSKRDNSEHGWSAWGKVAFVTDNVASASKWATTRKITLTGSVTGSVSIDGSGDVTLTTTTNHTHSYLPLSGGTMTGIITGNTGSGLIVQSANTGAWCEGLRIYPASNNFSVLSLQSSDSQNVFAMVTNVSSHVAYFDYCIDGGLAQIQVPHKSGTIALTSDLSAYLPLAGGTMGGTAWIIWPSSGNWDNGNSGVTFPVTRGGLEWRGQSDWVSLFSQETGIDNLDLVLQFGDDNSNGLSIRNSGGIQTAFISATGHITATNGTVNSTLRVGAIPVTNSSSGVLKIDGNLIVTGGITMYATDGVASGLMEQILVDGTTIGKKADGTLYAINTGNVRSIIMGTTTYNPNSSGVVTLPEKVTWANIEGKPSSFTPSVHTHSYLPYNDSRSTDYAPYSASFMDRGLSTVHLKYNSTDGLSDGGTYHSSIYIHPWGDSSGGCAHNLAFTDNGNIWLRSGTSSWGEWKRILNSSNYSSYALPLSGGTISGRLLVNYGVNHSEPAIAINYYDGYTVDESSIAQIKMGKPEYEMYLGLSPASQGYYGKVGYFMHIGTGCEFLWATSNWTKRMALECSSGNLWVAGSVTASSFVGNASSATALTSNAGDYATPVYFNGGKPVACTMSTGNGAGIVRSFGRGVYTSANQYFGNGTIVTIDPTGTGCITANDTILSLGDFANRNTQLLVSWSIDGVYYRRIADDLNYGDWKRLAFTTDNVASATNADTLDGYHASSLWRSEGATWNPGANILLNASGNGQEWSFDISRNGYTGCYWHVWDSTLDTMLRVNADNGKVYAPYNFVGNLEGNASSATTATTATTSSMLQTSTWKGGFYGDSHILCLGYMNCTYSFDSLTLLVTSAFWGNQHGSQDIITIQQDANLGFIQTTAGRLRLGGSIERTFYYYEDNTNLRLYLYVHVEGGNGYGAWNISYLGGNVTWVTQFQPDVTFDDSWVTIGYSAQGYYANSAGNADTVDGEHSSAFAHIGAHNDLIAAGNEFTFASSGQSGRVWFNYRTAGGTNGNITEYIFGNGAGASLGTAIHSGNYSSYALPLSGGTMTGTINATDGAPDTGIKFKSNNASLNALSDQHLILGSAIRFGDYNTWDWNVWAGLKYDSSSKTIYLGLADGIIFNANEAQSGGSLRFPGVSNLYMNVGSRISQAGGNLYLGTANNSGWLFFQDMASQGGTEYWKLTQEGYLTAKGVNLSEKFTSSVSSGTFLDANNGKAIINSTAAAGFNMLARMKSTNGVFIHGVYDNAYKFYYTSNATISAGTNATTAYLMSLGEDGYVITSHLVPLGNATCTFGLSSNRWIRGYFSNALHVGAANSTVTNAVANCSEFGAGYIELSHSTPYIDFHYGNSTGDYTSRIVATSASCLAITSNLYIGGTGDTTYKLRVAGPTFIEGALKSQGMFSVLDSAGFPKAKIDQSGNITANGGITMYSDLRKKNILSDEVLSVKEIAAAPLFRHTYKSDDNQYIHVGTSAQYWSGIHEEWFTRKDDEGYYQMELQNLGVAMGISLAREIVKYESKTDKKIRLMKEKINELEARVKELEERRTA